MKFHWGHYCILIAVVLIFLVWYIGFNPMLDRAFTPIKVYDNPLYMTHNYVEMITLFLFGIGISKSFQRGTKVIQAVMWLFLVLYSLVKAIELSTPVLVSFVGALLVYLPLPFGFYLYKFYHKRIRKQ